MNEDPNGRHDAAQPSPPDDAGSEHPTQPLWLPPPAWGPPTNPYAAPAAPPPAADSAPRHRLGAGLAALLLLVGALAGAGVARLATDQLRAPGTSNSTSSGAPFVQNPGSGSTSSIDVGAIGQKVSPAVVDINVTIGYQQAEAAGTGMVLTSDGEILTNNHVISGATRISVTDVGNGRTYTASVVGYDRSHDVAVLKLSGASSLRTVTIGDSSTVDVGAAVVAIGNGGGTGGAPSVAGGSVTALDQQITASDESNGASTTYTGLIATNADIVPGYSGGPLVDSSGRVIGINTAASVGFRFSSTEGYAIPIDAAMQIVDRIESGDATSTVHIGDTAMLGVSISSTGGRFAQQAGGGALIADVVSGGPADRAGLAAGDVITSIAGEQVSTTDDLSNAMTDLRPGQTVSVGFTTPSGDQSTVTVQLGSGPPQ